jgi:hypothetical protein
MREGEYLPFVLAFRSVFSHFFLQPHGDNAKFPLIKKLTYGV